MFVYSKAERTCKINLHSINFDIPQNLNWCKYVLDETTFSPAEIVCLVVHLVSKENNV
mgnify:CR=1 FL=1